MGGSKSSCWPEGDQKRSDCGEKFLGYFSCRTSVVQQPESFAKNSKFPKHEKIMVLVLIGSPDGGGSYSGRVDFGSFNLKQSNTLLYKILFFSVFCICFSLHTIPPSLIPMLLIIQQAKSIQGLSCPRCCSCSSSTRWPSSGNQWWLKCMNETLLWLVNALETKHFCAAKVIEDLVIINLLLRERKSCPDESLSIEMSARFHKLSHI